MNIKVGVKSVCLDERICSSSEAIEARNIEIRRRTWTEVKEILEIRKFNTGIVWSNP